MDKKPLGQNVPSGRWSRLARLGVMATSVAGGMLAEGARQLARGERPKIDEMLLTPANVRRVAEELSRLRGAAMKVGQLLSMDGGDLIPPALTEILSRLRSDAVSMPMSQLVTVLDKEWGSDWSNSFERFSFVPAAAASIGQVHQATTLDGLRLAIKVQYPGVRESIDSDVDNVAALLRMSGLLPNTFDIREILDEAKKQLHAEADYQAEGQWLTRYTSLLGQNSRFLLPRHHPELSTPKILAMSWVEGVSIESLVHETQDLRDQIAEDLFALVLKEIFDFRVVQTDPNFANYRFRRESQQLVLLDFGATREISEGFSNAYRKLMVCAISGDRPSMYAAAESIGYFNNEVSDQQAELVMLLLEMACEPLRHLGGYDFGASDLPRRIHAAGMALALDRNFWHAPPIDSLFLHRKLAGTYLLAARLSARVDIGRLVKRHI